MQKIQKSTKRNLILGFTTSLFILLLSSGISYFSIRELLESQRWVEHTSEVSSTLGNLMSTMKDAETGQRGYLLTGDEAFLEPYNGSKNKVMDLFINAQKLTIDNHSQQHDFPALEKLIKEKYNIIESTIADRKQGLQPSVKTLLRGKAIMDSVRTIIKVMNIREEQLMVVRNAKLSKYEVMTPIFIAVAALIGMLITLTFYRKIQESILIASRLEQELANKRSSVDRQVEIISNVANKISSGDYSARIDKDDLL
ncbi:CHASE3 domain-containing protein [Pedobacter sp. MC2016-15]|uniref:CHASE3 domain-containing protein n=1 Tax=Pedobacter sp. MC2016-15 TaxID=2994473 RepID=UPI002247FE60|nr:CHASE3 domain-containing protein [Pedobacter sp. MC2016-15]MCX2478333.1 CHASE3 domain-containing protein [Pedobacter sp. MC2016-15]